MQRIILSLIAAGAASILVGCSSTPVDSSSAKQVPTDRTFAFQQDVPGGAMLVVSRDNGFWASGGCYATVLVDGKKAARINTGETVKFKLKPGRHIVGISGDEDGSGLCAMQIGQPVKETASELSTGEVQKFRISGTQNGADIRPSSL
ncbi:hypothetical protein NYP20_01555 [Pseudomonas sp. N3-W]|uniref:hypothetical protein n=1 Tax=Pseudomonas sp. N3-W TaxID=2975049 RepID=UPI00217ECEE6|nr:hypothetical protein [Pseudomonas sp. N3-W]UWF49677.1 hypothetical protein NYP20_01555 [Pseudomonas sp. N3-W]